MSKNAASTSPVQLNATPTEAASTKMSNLTVIIPVSYNSCKTIIFQCLQSIDHNYCLKFIKPCLECVNPNPCENDGRCISLGKKENPYTCICKDGFVGSRCQFKNIVQTCGRSAYSATNDPAPIPNLFLNEYLNTDFLNR